MGKIITAEENAKKQEAQVKAFMEMSLKKAKQSGVSTGYAHYGRMPEPNRWYVSIENNCTISDIMEYDLSKHPVMSCVSKKEYPGSFDWASDTYIKDSSEVVIKF
jgi:hypothetical protein